MSGTNYADQLTRPLRWLGVLIVIGLLSGGSEHQHTGEAPAASKAGSPESRQAPGGARQVGSHRP